MLIHLTIIKFGEECWSGAWETPPPYSLPNLLSSTDEVLRKHLDPNRVTTLGWEGVLWQKANRVTWKTREGQERGEMWAQNNTLGQ